MKKIKDITGKKFGRLRVISFIERKNRHTFWNCICDCGKKVIVNNNNLSTGHTKSCGCFRIYFSRKKATSHGFTSANKKARFWIIFIGIKQRTQNKNLKKYKNYGNRGIKCLWKNFEEFKNDMYKSYKIHVKKFGEKNTTIDRINNNGDYCKQNCRWATIKEQNRNRRSNLFIKFNNKIHCISEWAEKYNMPICTLWHRLNRGWTIKKSLTFPIKR